MMQTVGLQQCDGPYRGALQQKGLNLIKGEKNKRNVSSKLLLLCRNSPHVGTERGNPPSITGQPHFYPLVKLSCRGETPSSLIGFTDAAA